MGEDMILARRVGVASSVGGARMDQRTQAQVVAHHRAGRHWWRRMCACGVRWARCPDAHEAGQAAAR